MDNRDFTWCIAYVNADHLKLVDYQLAKNKDYQDISAYIPTVQVLKKQFKNKDHFEDVPLLFNYGFFRIPTKKVLNPEFLVKLKADISAIIGWVKDISKVTATSGMNVAVASEEEISALIEYSKSNSIYTSEDIENLKEGDFITLIGYPWEGMQAQVKTVNVKKREADVILCIDAELTKTIKVSFDNIFYTIYHGGFDENESREKIFDHPLRTGADKSQYND